MNYGEKRMETSGGNVEVLFCNLCIARKRIKGYGKSESDICTGTFSKDFFSQGAAK